MWQKRSRAQKVKDFTHLATFYWSRLLATGGCWLFWDFGFYGNKIFQSEFIHVLTGGSECPLSASLHHPRLATIRDQPALLCSAQRCRTDILYIFMVEAHACAREP